MERLPDAELEVMRAVWGLAPPCPTGEVRRELEKTRSWNLSALQTLLGRLAGRGFLTSGRDGRQRTWTPLVEQEDYLAFEHAPFFHRGRGAAVSRLVACLYERDSLTRGDLEDLRAFLDKAMEQEGP